MGTIVRLKVNRHAGITAQTWKDQAVGIIDEYGNPFRLIKLRWNLTQKHKMSDYGKTRGFEDAVLNKDSKTGGIKITYRRPGSIMWERLNGIGAFMGEVPETPTNMNLLASHYGDKLWTIIDRDIDEIVKKMYEVRRGKETPELKAFNDQRIAKLHTHHFDSGKDVKIPELSPEVSKKEIEERERINRIEESKLKQRKLALDAKEKEITEKNKGLIDEGYLPVVYQKEYLDSQKLFALRKICKNVGVKWVETDKKDSLIQKIMDKQSGNISEVEAKTSAIMGSLDS